MGLSGCDNPNTVTSFDKTAITNIYTPRPGSADALPGSERAYLWAHLVALWLIVLLVMKVSAAYGQS